MTRKVFALDLVDDCALIAAYEERHAPGAVWQDVVADIRARGIVEMEIWRVADRVMMICEVSPDHPRPSPAAYADTVSRWEAEMDRFQRPIGDPEPKWKPMSRIFDLAEQ